MAKKQTIVYAVTADWLEKQGVDPAFVAQARRMNKLRLARKKNLQDDRVSPIYHFSVDDVCRALVDAARYGDDPFKHDFFAFLKHLHDRANVNVDLYCFYQDGGVTLADVPSSFRDAFAENDWLRFGPHAMDYASAPHAVAPAKQREVFDLICAEIDRFAGPASYCEWLRLHYFSESFELAEYFQRRGITTLLTTDKPIGCYRLPAKEADVLRRTGTVAYGGIDFALSHFRLENVVLPTPGVLPLAGLADAAVAAHGFVVCFTHERELVHGAVREAAVTFVDHMKARGIVSRSYQGR